MKTAVVYVVPVDNLDVFKPDIERFVSTLRQFPAGEWHELHVVYNYRNKEDGALKNYASSLFGDLHRVHHSYFGEGCDIGSHQFAANGLDADFMLCLSTRAFFHRAGWLKRFAEVWERYPDSLLGAMGSYERCPHIRTCAYAISPKRMRDYPWAVNSRAATFDFETGPNNITRRMLGFERPVLMVDWEGFHTQPFWRTPANIFRRGDQSDCVVWDKHTKIWSEETPERREVLTRYADGK